MRSDARRSRTAGDGEEGQRLTESERRGGGGARGRETGLGGARGGKGGAPGLPASLPARALGLLAAGGGGGGGRGGGERSYRQELRGTGAWKPRVASRGRAACVPGQRSAGAPGASAVTGRAGQRPPTWGYSTVTPRTGCMGPGTSILVPQLRGSGAPFKRRTKASLKTMSTQILRSLLGRLMQLMGKDASQPNAETELAAKGIGLGGDPIRNAYLARARLLMKG